MGDFVVMFVCVCACVYACTCSGGSGGWHLRHAPFVQVILFPCHFQPKRFQIIGWCTPIFGVGAPSGKSWTHPRSVAMTPPCPCSHVMFRYAVTQCACVVCVACVSGGCQFVIGGAKNSAKMEGFHS